MKAANPILSLDERDRRWGLVRELMRANGLDCLIVAGLNGREHFDGYLSNDHAQGIVVFPREGEPTYLTWTSSRITRHIENCLRGATSWIEDWRVGATGAGLADTLREKNFESTSIGVVGLESQAPSEGEGYIPYRTWAYVLEHLPRSTFVDVSQRFFELVLIKSEEEQEFIRHSARIGEMACRAMLEITRPGVGENEIYSTVMSVIFANGAGTPSPHLILHSGVDNTSWGEPIWIYQAQRPRVVQKGDMVQAEIFARYGGFETQQQMAVALKPLHPVNQRLAEVARSTYEIGLKALRPGKTFQEVADAMEVPVAEAGCWHLTPLIHSLSPLEWVGPSSVRIAQLPGIENYSLARPAARSKEERVIKPGMVFELEPNACLGKHRVNIGGAVLVTEYGVEELNKLPTVMQVVD